MKSTIKPTVKSTVKSTVENLKGLSHRLTVEVPAEQVWSTFQKAFQEVRQSVTMKGFRKGKAPTALIHERYLSEVKKDVLNKLVWDSYAAALDEHDLDPIGNPTFKLDPLDEKTQFSYSVEFEVSPSIDNIDYVGLEVNQSPFEVKEEDVERSLQRCQDAFTLFQPVEEDRGVQMGDQATIDFFGFVEGQPLKNGQAENHLLRIGRQEFIAGFEEGLLGMKVGEQRELQLKFPDQYGETELSGKPVQFKVTLKDFKSSQVPELNDELAQKIGVPTIEKLRNLFHLQIEKELQKKADEDLQKQLLRALVEKNPLPLPESLVAVEKKRFMEGLVKRYSDHDQHEHTAECNHDHDHEHDHDHDHEHNHDHDPAHSEKIKQKMEEFAEETATFMVHASLLIRALAQKLNLVPDDDEVYQEARRRWAASGRFQKSQDLDKFLDHDRVMEFKSRWVEERVVAVLKEKAKMGQVLTS